MLKLSSLTLSAIILTACSGAVPKEQALKDQDDVTALVEKFEEIAFGREYGNISDSLAKWSTDIKVGVSGAFSESEVDLIAQQVRLIEHHTNHTINVAESGAQANLHIYKTNLRGKLDRLYHLTGNNKFPYRFLAGSCSSVAQVKNGHIRKVDIFVRDDLPAQEVGNCLVEELAQSMGLVNDSDKYPSSVFSDLNIQNRLSETDLLLLRLFYDPRLKPGMGRAESTKIVRQIYSEIVVANRNTEIATLLE